METVKYDIGSKRKSAALDGVKKSKTFLEGKSAETMAKSCDAASGNGKVCLDLLKQMDAALDPLSGFIKDSQDAFTGSEQERTALDMAYIEQGKVTKLLTQLEEFMVPTSYITPVPDEYNDLPQLKTRATVEMLIKKGEPGAQFDVNGVNYYENCTYWGFLLNSKNICNSRYPDDYSFSLLFFYGNVCIIFT